MIKSLLLLDKDGTIIQPKSGQVFVQNPKDQELIKDAAEAIALYRRSEIMIISNQGGVAAGHKTLEEAIAEMQYALELSKINSGFLCPDFEGQECYWVTANQASKLTQHSGSYRKPNPGMVFAAIELFKQDHGVKPKQVIVVGDRDEDRDAASAVIELGGIMTRFHWASDWREEVHIPF